MAAALGVLFVLLSAPAHAQITWTGNGDGTSWSDAGNWSSQTVPGSGDEVQIDATPGTAYTVELSSDRTVAALTLSSNDATLAANANLTITGEHTHLRGTLTGSGTVRVEGAFRWENGTRGGTGTTVAAGGFTIPSAVTLDGRRLVLPTGATGVYDSVYNLTATNGAVLEVESGAAFDIQREGHLEVASGSAARPTLINRGTVRKTGDFSTDIGWALDNQGVVEADLQTTGSSHYLRFTGPLIDDGGTYRATNGRLSLRPTGPDVTFGPGSTIQADSSGTINFGRGTSASDTLSIRVEGTVDVRGTTTVRGGKVASVTIAAGATVEDLGGTALRVGGNRGVLMVNTTDPISVGRLRLGFQGRLRVQSALTVAGEYRQDPDPSTFTSDHLLTVQGPLVWEGGTMAGTGTTVAESGLTLTGGLGSGSNAKLLDERRLVVPTGETGAYPGAYLTGTNGATLEIESGATFDVQGQGSLTVASSSSARPTIVNHGTLKKTGNYRTEITWGVENADTIEADLPTTGSSHYLRLAGPLTDDGGTYRATNGRLGVLAATPSTTFGPGSTIRATASSTIRFGRASSVSADTASFRLEGVYDVDGTTAVRSGNNFVSVTIGAGATLDNLGGTALKVGDNRGLLTVNTTDPLSVGRLRLAFGGHLRVRSALTVRGPYTQDPDPSSFTSEHPLIVEGALTWEGGTMAGTDTTWAEGGLRLPGGFGSGSNAKHLRNRVLVLPGGTGSTYSGAYLSGAEAAAIVVRPEATFTFQSRGGLSVASDTAARPALRNEGTLRATNGRSDIEWDFVNHDTLDIEGPDGHLRFLGPVRSTDQLYVGPDAQLSHESDSALVNRGFIGLQDQLLTQSPLRNEGGTIAASGSAALVQGTLGSVPSDPDTVLHMQGGTLHGTARISGHVVNDDAAVRPGGDGASGQIEVQGTYVQRSDGVLATEFGGTTAGDGYDQLKTERVRLAGRLNLSLIDDYTPDSTDVLTPVRWTDSTRTGSFGAIDGQNQSGVFLAAQYEPTALQVYDGSVTTPAFAQVPNYKVQSPPFQREDRKITFSFSTGLDSSVTQDVLATVSPSGKSAPSIHSDCPTSGDYSEFRCRMERFGVSPPPPPDGQSYPDLGNETLFGTSPGGADLAPEGNVATLTGLGSTEQSGGAGDQEETECGGNPSAKLTVGEQLMGSGQFKMCAFELAKLSLNVVPGSNCFDLAKTITSKVGTGFVKGQFDHEGYAMAAVLDAADCASDFTPGKWVKVAQKVHSTYSAANGIKSAVSSCAPVSASLSPRRSSTRCIGSTDPNDKFGLRGVGARQYTARQDSLPYTVFFENKPDATAPAQDVVITDTLTTDRFDASTFSFGPIAFGDTTIFPTQDTLAFSRDVDLRPDRDLIVRIEGSLDAPTGLLRWTFTSMDPESAGLDPTEGFLPPNDTPPEGEGSVSYFVDLESGLASGTEFGRAAQIVFDNNAPIDTPVWSNVLDVASPSSAVDALASTQDTVDFEVSWDGQDAESGIRHYTVYVATNDGPYTPWITDTTATTATFEGERGKTYSFYSVAEDSVGLTESNAGTADASTTVAADAIPVELADMAATVEGDRVALTWKTASETNNAGFEVQRRSGSQGRFRRIGFVEGTGTTSEPQTYRFTDSDVPYAADTLRYRLRQVDTDGSARVTDAVAVARGGVERVQLKETFPNPARSQVTVRYAIPEETDASAVTVRLYDLLGRRVQTVTAGTTTGRHEVQLSVGDLASGVYLLRLTAGGASRTRRLTIAR